MASGPKVRSREGGKKQRTKRPVSKKSNAFIINGDNLIRKLKTCSKCGSGVYLADHNNRESCGKCGYTQFKQGNQKPQNTNAEQTN